MLERIGRSFGSKPISVFSTIKAFWLGQWLLDLWVAPAIYKPVSFFPWVSLWFPCRFAGRWCHPVSKQKNTVFAVIAQENLGIVFLQ